MSKWEMVRFSDCFEDVTSKAKKIPKESYLEMGVFPIVDQGKSKIAGYTNEKDGIFEYVPAIIFGDHTRVLKYINFPLFIGADGVKLLRQKYEKNDSKFLFYALSNVKILDTGYNRHFKWLKEAKIPLPPLEIQKKIADELDKISGLIEMRKKQIDKLDLLVKAKFVEMFGDPVRNEMGWEVKTLGETTKILTGNTPPRNDKMNYGKHIEWIKTDNITSDLYPTSALEYLSEKGAAKGRIVEKNCILMACIAGSIKSIGRVAVTNREVAFNQQINAVIPISYNTIFLYTLFQKSQVYIQSTINMSLKGILSKGKMETLEFIVPPLNLQNQFADYVEKIEESKEDMRKGLEQLEILYKERMQEYFG